MSETNAAPQLHGSGLRARRFPGESARAGDRSSLAGRTDGPRRASPVARRMSAWSARARACSQTGRPEALCDLAADAYRFRGRPHPPRSSSGSSRAAGPRRSPSSWDGLEYLQAGFYALEEGGVGAWIWGIARTRELQQLAAERTFDGMRCRRRAGRPLLRHVEVPVGRRGIVALAPHRLSTATHESLRPCSRPRLHPAPEGGRARARRAHAGQDAPDGPMSGAPRAPGLLTVLSVAALVVLALTAPPAGAQAQEPRLPRELWNTYPLDPTRGETGEQSTGSGGATRSDSRPPAATTTARAPRGTPQADGGASVPVLLAALGGLAWLLAAGLAVVIARRRGRLLPQRLRRRRTVIARGARGAGRSLPALAVAPARRPANAARTVRPPRPRIPQRLRSESGALLPLAEPSARKTRIEPPEPNRVSQGEALPKQTSLPDFAPPPAKERQVRSGLPAWKTVPRQVRLPPKKDRAATPSEPELRPGPPGRAVRLLNRTGGVDPRQAEHRTSGACVRAGACEIQWWRGYLRSDFYAFAVRPGGTTTVIARSPSFHWRSSDPPPSRGPAAEAHAALVERLGTEGWESAGTGDAWYRTRLRRRLTPTLRDFANSAGRAAS
jgi:hypothetical protein